MKWMNRALPALVLAGLFLGCTGEMPVAKYREMDLAFPMAGLNKRGPYGGQPPYSTPDCMNVRPVSTFDRRAQGGSRPGLYKAWPSQLMHNSPGMLAQVMHVAGQPSMQSWRDPFIGGTITNPPWNSLAGYVNLPTPGPGYGIWTNYNRNEGMLLQKISDFDPLQPHTVAIVFPEDQRTLWSDTEYDYVPGAYRIVGGMTTDSPDWRVNGWSAQIEIGLPYTTHHGKAKVVIYIYVNSVATAVIGTEFDWTTHGDHLLTATVNPATNTLTVYLDGTEKLSATNAGIGTAAGTRFGLAMHNAYTTEFYNISTGILGYMLSYQTPASSVPTGRQTLLVDGTDMYCDDGSGTFASVQVLDDDAAPLTSDGVQGAPFGQDLFMANSKGIIWEGDVSVAADGITVTTASGGMAGLYSGSMALITNGSAGIVNGMYRVTTSNYTRALLAGSVGAGGTCHVRGYYPNQVYSSSLKKRIPWMATSGKGMVPPGCDLLCTWRNKLVMAGSVDAPNGIYMCRSNDPYDWLYAFVGSEDDVNKPIAFDSSTDAIIGEPVTAIVPFSDDYLLVGCPSTLYVLRGDPGLGGTFDNMSSKVGIIAKNAWCRTPDGAAVFLSQDGLYTVQPGAGGTPQPFSQQSLPDDLREVDVRANRISMCFSVVEQGIHIYITPKNGTTGSHWFVHWSSGTFWPMSFANLNHQPIVVTEILDSRNSPQMVVIGNDGYLRSYSDDQITDDGEVITSYVDMGPARMGGTSEQGIVTRLIGTFADNSVAVSWGLYCDATAEKVVNLASPQVTETWTPGLNYIAYPRVAGGAYKLRLSSTGRWAMESINVQTLSTGLQRKS